MRRTIILAYSVLVYALFLAVFCYLIGFVSGLLVPKSVNDGPAGPLWLALAVDLGLIGLFGLQHAVMARPAFKERLTRLVPREAERSTFVLAASAVLVLLFWLWRPIDLVIWQVNWEPGRAVLWAVHFSGWAVVLLSTFLIDHFDLFGLRQAWLAFKGRSYAHHPFVVRSLYRVVRHPLMLGFLIAFWAAPTMTGGRLLFAAGMTVYILIGVRMEERDLVAHHGQAYEDYRRRTPSLIPIPGRLAKRQQGEAAAHVPESASAAK